MLVFDRLCLLSAFLCRECFVVGKACLYQPYRLRACSRQIVCEINKYSCKNKINTPFFV